MTKRGKDDMVAILFHVEAKPGKRQELLSFLEWDSEESLKWERETLRFDVFQDPETRHAFYVCEVYEDVAAVEEHKTHEPFQLWWSAEFQNEVVLRHFDLTPPCPQGVD